MPLNSATVINASMSAIEVAEARGRSLASAALMSLSKFLARGAHSRQVATEKLAVNRIEDGD
jgi:hypothetical protein